MDEFLEIVLLIMAWLCAAAIVMVGVAHLIIAPIDEKECRVQAEGMGVAYDYGLISECKFLIEGKLIPKENYIYGEVRQ